MADACAEGQSLRAIADASGVYSHERVWRIVEAYELSRAAAE
jgi:hypothetical protein